MKISKIVLAISLIIFLTLIVFVSRFAYNMGQHNASLTIREATPLQLAEAMQHDNFYGEYIRTMLLIKGSVKDVTKQNQDTIVQFNVTNSPTVLGKVSCDVGNNQTQVKVGDTIRVLTVAYDAQRQHTSDVFMPKCYLLQD